MKRVNGRRDLGARVLAAVVVAAFLLAAGQAALAQQVIIPDTVPGAGGGADVGKTAQSLFNTVTTWVLMISGGVLVLVVMAIGLRLAMQRDSRARAETYDWLMHAAIGAGLIFGATVVVRLLVGLYSTALR